MRQELSVLPTAWLTSAPIPINNAASILLAFKPGTAKVIRFVGPHKLYRAAGWDAKNGSMASREKGQGLRWFHTYNFNSHNCDYRGSLASETLHQGR